MKRTKITVGHQQMMPFLMLKDIDMFIDFTRKIFNAEERVRRLDRHKRVEYSELRVGDTTVMITQAVKGDVSSKSAFYIYVNDADAIFYKALDNGAVPLMFPMNEDDETRSAGFEDPMGCVWWITTLN
ncbi:Uncharacterized conserved protein PhnB, glyoxalase superfamily [Zhouia amylolytica]|uniref:Glyoxalase/fosfomycin resistance/dioxygenase domain-containing protein n=2 Tax=Zhouia amylolytica TaxID=376730 RepID=W2ULE0_9FLAO|nr:VOC family protein [Zhouia amylolytica]ETN94152.1 hypothetical protein P278_29560 [Zhouia amylolytica AD3]MCQ0112339.1 hypothetical protein [Zhouia amylolytica]SFS40915.1 Uncharacterized conserved protein PhnB, glyoxalase superfamily [Zhouia amylolytica]